MNVAVQKGEAILKLFASEDETLLIWRDTLLVLDLCLDVVNCIRRFHLEGDGFSGQSLHKDLNATAERKDCIRGNVREWYVNSCWHRVPRWRVDSFRML